MGPGCWEIWAAVWACWGPLEGEPPVMEVCNEGITKLGGVWLDTFTWTPTSVRTRFAAGSFTNVFKVDPVRSSVGSFLAFTITVFVWAGLATTEAVPAGCSSQTVVVILLLEGPKGAEVEARALVIADGAPLGKSGWFSFACCSSIFWRDWPWASMRSCNSRWICQMPNQPNSMRKTRQQQHRRLQL